MPDWLGILALAASAVQALLMGFVGYPISLSQRNGMEKFHRSGFTWWLITLMLLVGLAIVLAPGTLSLSSPNSEVSGIAVVVFASIVGAAGCIGFELTVSVWRTRRRADGTDRGAERYNDALPLWGRLPLAELLLLSATAVLEEAVYRGIGMSWLTADQSVPWIFAVVLTAAVFGLAHWYYGPHQVVLKFVLGLILGLVAWYGSWVAAALAHLLLNLSLLTLSRRNSTVIVE